MKVKERKPRREKTDRQKIETLLDELYREYIRRRAMKRVGGCERCHTPKLSYRDLQAAHFHTRGGHTTRWDIRNSVGLCGGCHMYIDSHEEEKIEFENDSKPFSFVFIPSLLNTNSSIISINLSSPSSLIE